MASKTVELILTANNQASGQVQALTSDIETMVGMTGQLGQAADGAVSGMLSGLQTLSPQMGILGVQIAANYKRIKLLTKAMKLNADSSKKLKAGWMAAAFALGLAIGKMAAWALGIGTAEEHLKNYNKTQARTNELLKRQSGELMDDAKFDISLIKDPKEKQKAYEELISVTRKNLAGLQTQQKMDQSTIEGASGIIKNFAWQSQIKAEAMEELAVTEQRILDMGEEHVKLMKMLAREEQKAAVAAKEKLAAEKAATTKKGTDRVEELKREVAIYGMTTREVERYDLALSNLDATHKKQAKTQLDLLDQMDKDKEKRKQQIETIKDLKEAALGFWDALKKKQKEAVEANKKEQEGNRKRAEKMRQDSLSPAEKAAGKLRELKELQKAGYLTAKQEQKARQKIKMDLKETVKLAKEKKYIERPDNAADQSRFQTQVKSGTAETLKEDIKRNEHWNRLSDQYADQVQLWKDVKNALKDDVKDRKTKFVVLNKP